MTTTAGSEPAFERAAERAPADAEPVRGGSGVPVLAAVLLALASVGLGIALRGWWDGRPPGTDSVAVGFFDDMTTHHFQAIAMARVYARDGDDSVLRSIADEIAFSQAGDIRVMQDALTAWGATPDHDTAMEWMDRPVPQDAQPGMASAADMAALTAARGRELDDRFTRLMIEHHAGGAAMAQAARRETSVDEASDLAGAMAATQLREIHELNRRRTHLGLELHEPVSHAAHL